MAHTMSKAKRRKIQEARREARMATIPVEAYRHLCWATDEVSEELPPGPSPLGSG